MINLKTPMFVLDLIENTNKLDYYRVNTFRLQSKTYGRKTNPFKLIYDTLIGTITADYGLWYNYWYFKAKDGTIKQSTMENILADTGEQYIISPEKLDNFADVKFIRQLIKIFNRLEYHSEMSFRDPYQCAYYEYTFDGESFAWIGGVHEPAVTNNWHDYILTHNRSYGTYDKGELCRKYEVWYMGQYRWFAAKDLADNISYSAIYKFETFPYYSGNDTWIPVDFCCPDFPNVQCGGILEIKENIINGEQFSLLNHNMDTFPAFPDSPEPDKISGYYTTKPVIFQKFPRIDETIL